jgi:hypothetical protein
MLSADRRPLMRSNCIAWKGHEIVVVVFLDENNAVHVNRLADDCSINFVLCQGESGSGASLGACNQDSSMWRCRF